MTMDALFKSITARFIATPHSDFYTAVNGQLYYDFIPDEAALPYAAIFPVNGNQRDGFTEEVTDALIQLNIFTPGGSVASAWSAVSAAMSFFTAAPFAPTGRLPVRLINSSRFFPRLAGTDPYHWQSSGQFRALIIKP